MPSGKVRYDTPKSGGIIGDIGKTLKRRYPQHAIKRRHNVRAPRLIRPFCVDPNGSGWERHACFCEQCRYAVLTLTYTNGPRL